MHIWIYAYECRSSEFNYSVQLLVICARSTILPCLPSWSGFFNETLAVGALYNRYIERIFFLVLIFLAVRERSFFNGGGGVGNKGVGLHCIFLVRRPIPWWLIHCKVGLAMFWAVFFGCPSISTSRPTPPLWALRLYALPESKPPPLSSGDRWQGKVPKGVFLRRGLETNNHCINTHVGADLNERWVFIYLNFLFNLDTFFLMASI